MPNVSEVLLDVLAETGVERVYGIPGDAINSLVEALRHRDDMEFVQVRHEEVGAFAASAHAKLTGKLGVCVGTAGPGAVHLLNGLYDAKLDHAPVLAVTGQVETRYIGTDYHQEVDLYTLFKDVAAYNQTVMTPGQMPQLAVHACQTALAGRGVAHLSLPVDIASEEVPDADRRHSPFRARSRITPCEPDLDAAAEVLEGAGKVTILAGVGCVHAREELVDTAETLGSPIIKTLRAKDVLPDEHPLAVGGLGLLGTRPAVQAMEDCDAFLMVGTDFPYHDFYPDDTPAVQIDVDPYQLGKRYPVDVGLVGHAAPTLRALRERLSKKEDRGHLERAQERMRRWWERMDRKEQSDEEPLHPQAVARLVGRLADDDAIFTCDTGAVTVWGARNLRLRGDQRFVLSSSLASMAFAMPAAIGARLGHPDRQVVSLSGDGGFSMLMGDFLTAVKYELPITVVVFNNGKLGLIQMEQEVQGYPEYQTSLQDMDYGAFARAAGGEGTRVTGLEALEGALREALASDRPWVVDVEINPEERTMPPRIEPGQAFGYGLAKMKELLGEGGA